MKGITWLMNYMGPNAPVQPPAPTTKPEPKAASDGLGSAGTAG